MARKLAINPTIEIEVQRSLKQLTKWAQEDEDRIAGMQTTNVASTTNAAATTTGLSPQQQSIFDLVSSKLKTIVSSSGGGGSSILFGTYASLPAPAAKGTLYKTTDDGLEFISNGSAWLAFYRSIPITLPNDASMAWVNQTTASVSQTTGVVELTATNPSAGDNVMIRKKSIGIGTPYHIELGVLPVLFTTNIDLLGLVLRDSVSGKLYLFGPMQQNNNAFLAIYAFNSPTSSNSNKLLQSMTWTPSPVFLKIVDDGVNRIFYWSPDGQMWMQVFSVSDTDFLVPNEVGYFVYSNGAGPVDAAIFHFKIY